MNSHVQLFRFPMLLLRICGFASLREITPEIQGRFD